MGCRGKVPELAEGGAEIYPQPFVSDPKLEDPDQTAINGIQGRRDRSVYLTVSLRDWCSYPLASFSSDPSRRRKTRFAKLPTGVSGSGMSFVSLQQSRWIVGVGGDPGATVFYDTKTDRVIRGPQLVAAKLFPVLAAVGYRVYALSSHPSDREDIDVVPWFEVLDLKDAMITHKADDGSLCLDRCSWKPLPSPLCFPGKVTPVGYKMPSMISSVRSNVVVDRYMLVSLNRPMSSGIYAFDTVEHEWCVVDMDRGLPFVGTATPHGESGCIFLGSSKENGPVSAYRICVSASSSPSSICDEGGICHKGGALKVSITEFSVKSIREHGKGVDAVLGDNLVSLDRERFLTLSFALDHHRRSRIYDMDEFCPRKLFAKLTIYQIGNPEILEEAVNEEKLRAVRDA